MIGFILGFILGYAAAVGTAWWLAAQERPVTPPVDPIVHNWGPDHVDD